MGIYLRARLPPQIAKTLQATPTPLWIILADTDFRGAETNRIPWHRVLRDMQTSVERCTLRPWREGDQRDLGVDRVLVKAGYRHEGTLVASAIKDGQIRDRELFAITRQEHSHGAS